MTRFRLAALAGTLVTTSLLVPAARAANQVFVVDQAGNPGADFLQIQDAVAAAGDGDTVLVRMGTYGGVTVDGKGLSILADTGSAPVRPTVQWLRVRNLPASRRVVLRGLRAAVTPSPFGVTIDLEISTNTGHVLVENCEFLGGAPAVRVQDTGAAVFTRCTIAPSGVGIHAVSSAIHVHQSAVSGSAGGDTVVTPFGTIHASTGHPAVLLDGGLAVLAGGLLSGGNGGNGNATCDPAADGGPAVRVLGANPQAITIGATLAGGQGGTSCGGNGVPGPPADVLAGSLTAIAESHRTVVIDSPVREGQSAILSVTGEPGEPTLFLFSLAENAVWSPALSGTLIPGAPLLAAPFVTIPPGGTVALGVPMPPNALPAGVEALDLFLQVAVPGANGQGVVGGSSVLTIVDASL